MIVESPFTIIAKVERYNKQRNVLECSIIEPRMWNHLKNFKIDPFFSCAFGLTDEEYEAGKGYELEGKIITMNRPHLSLDVIVASENDFDILND